MILSTPAWLLKRGCCFLWASWGTGVPALQVRLELANMLLLLRDTLPGIVALNGREYFSRKTMFQNPLRLPSGWERTTSSGSLPWGGSWAAASTWMKGWESGSQPGERLVPSSLAVWLGKEQGWHLHTLDSAELSLFALLEPWQRWTLGQRLLQVPPLQGQEQNLY